MSCLLKSPLFQEFPNSKLQDLFLKFEKVYIGEGEDVIKEGRPGDYFYVIERGSVELFNHSGSLNVALGVGDYFGAEALVSCSPRNATVRMKEDGVLQRINSDDFQELISEVVLRYVKPEDLGTLNGQYRVLDVRMPVEYRLAHFPGAVNIPVSRLRAALERLDRSCIYIVSDEAAERANSAAFILCQAGFHTLILKGASTDKRLSRAS